jgi:hypothetical protein
MTGSVQRTLVECQAREAINRASKCPECQLQLRRNGSHRMSYRTPFGRLDLGSPRFYRCRCQTKARQSFSPLVQWLGDHTSPELQYLEAQFAALLSYGVSARILGSVPPLQHATSITTWKRQVARVGGRLDKEAHQRGVCDHNPRVSRRIEIPGATFGPRNSDRPTRQGSIGRQPHSIRFGIPISRCGNARGCCNGCKTAASPNDSGSSKRVNVPYAVNSSMMRISG